MLAWFAAVAQDSGAGVRPTTGLGLFCEKQLI